MSVCELVNNITPTPRIYWIYFNFETFGGIWRDTSRLGETLGGVRVCLFLQSALCKLMWGGMNSLVPYHLI